MLFAEVNTDSSISLALIAIVATVITALFKLLNDNTKALSDMTEATQKVAAETKELRKETKIGNKEAKERNGHLGEQSLHLAKLVTAQNKDVAGVKINTRKTAEILSKSALIAAEDRDLLISPQIIAEQHVEHQTVQTQESGEGDIIAP